jgi:hypothetical protein
MSDEGVREMDGSGGEKRVVRIGAVCVPIIL